MGLLGSRFGDMLLQAHGKGGFIHCDIVGHGEPVFLWFRRVRRIKGITQHMAVLIVPIHPSRGIIGLLPWGSGQSRLNVHRLLLVEQPHI